MAIEVTVRNRNPSEVMDIVKEIRSQGYVQGIDFDFAYHHSTWDDMIGEIPRYTVFTFYVEKYATLFTLKYGN